MKYPTVFHLLATELGKAKIPFVLVGGFVVNYYKATRHTDDVDILMTDENFKKALPLLERAGYKQVAKESAFTRLQGNRSDFLDLDVLFVDPRTFSGILKECKEFEMQGVKLKVPSLKHLMALKLHALKNNQAYREYPDLVDLINLVRFNKVDVAKDEFRALCLQYGNQALYDKIVRVVTAWKN